MMNSIEIKGLTKTYPGFSMENINLSLPNGSIMGLVGENGAGKSTLMKLILDISKRDNGEIRIFGKDNRENIELVKEDIGVVFDDVGIPSYLNAVEVGKVMKFTYKNWVDSLYNDYLKKMDIPTNKKFGEFSRGMKMKLGIAVALSHNPKLLLLDEATSGLDPVVRDEITDIFSDFTKDENHSILISSHIVSDLEKLCDYVSFIHKGKLILSDKKDVLKERYAVIHCTLKQLEEIKKDSIIGKKESAYGIEVIIERAAVPSGFETFPVGLEDLFIFMVKGELTK